MLNAGTNYNIIKSYNNQCIWSLAVSDGINTKVIGYPLTIEFNIVRNTFASANSATFNIYNLSPSTRSSEFFFQDRFNIKNQKVAQRLDNILKFNITIFII